MHKRSPSRPEVKAGSGPNWSARRGETIRGKLKRADDGKFSSDGGGSSPEPAPKAKGKAAAKPKADPATTRRANQEKVAAEGGLPKSVADALIEFASPDEAITLSPANAAALVAAGMVEKFEDGSYALTAQGRAFASAARSGNVRAAQDAVTRGKAKAGAAAAEGEEPAAEEEAPAAGGGGGGGGKAEKTPEELAAEKELKEKTNRVNVARELGGSASGDLATLSRLSAGADLDDSDDTASLIAQGLAKQGADGKVILTPRGNTFLAAASRGDAEAARYALTAAKEDKAKADARGAAKEERAKASQAKATERAQAKTKKAEERAQATAAQADARAKATEARAQQQRVKDAERAGRQVVAAQEKIQREGAQAKAKAEREAAAKQKAAEREQAKADKAAAPARNRAATAQTIGYRAGDVETLAKMSAGANPSEAEIDGLAQDGLVEAVGDNEFVMTPEGRSFLQALERGDGGRARMVLADAKAKAAEPAPTPEAKTMHIKAGARHSSKDQALLQEMHDRAVELGAACGKPAIKIGDHDEETLAPVGEGEAATEEEEGTPSVEGSRCPNCELAWNETEPGFYVCPDCAMAGHFDGEQTVPANLAAESMPSVLALADEVEESDTDEPTEEAPAPQTEGEAPVAVKSLGGGKLLALAVRFGSPSQPDLSPMRDYFTKATDYWLDKWPERPMLYNHALDEATKDDPVVGVWTKARIDDVGVWLEGQLDLRHRYYAAVTKLIDAGALAISTDSASHLVQRKKAPNNTHEVTRWPLLAASLTPTPAEPRLQPVAHIKSAYKAAGLALPVGIDDADPEAQTSTGADAQRLERERRLRIELDLIDD